MPYEREAGIGAGIASGIRGGLDALTGIEQIKQARQKEILTNLEIQKEKETFARGNQAVRQEDVVSGLPEYLRDDFVKMAKQYEIQTPDGTVGYRRRDMAELKDFVKNTPGLAMQIPQKEYDWANANYEKAKAALEEYQAQGKDPEALKNDKKYQAIQQEAQKWKMQSQTAFQKVVGIQDRMKELEKNYTPDSIEAWMKGEGKPVPRQMLTEEEKTARELEKARMRSDDRDADRAAKITAAAVKAAKGGDDKEEKQRERYSKRDNGYRADAHKLASASVKGMTGVKIINGPEGPQIDMGGNADAEKKYSDTYSKAYGKLVNQAKKNKMLPNDWSTGEDQPEQPAAQGGGQKVGYYKDDAGKTWYFDGQKWRYSEDGKTWNWGEPK